MFSKHKSYYKSINNEIKIWLEENYEKWEEDGEEWFNAKMIKKIPVELLPAKALVGKYAVLGIFKFADILETLDCLSQVSKYKSKINGKGMSHYGTYGNVYGFECRPSFKLDE